MNLNDKTILVTGAAGGLGRVVVEILLSAGANVIGTDRYPEPLDLLKKSISTGQSRFHARAADTLSTDQMATLVQNWRKLHGELHGLVATVGAFMPDSNDFTAQLSTFDKMMDLNVRSFLIAAHATCESIVASGGGAMVAIGARPALHGQAGLGAYSASKGALLRLVESMAAEHLSNRVRVNAVLPSIIDTPTNRLSMPHANPAAWVSPQSLAGVVLFLLSDWSRDITGASIPVYGRS